jgi:hypothetical protein
LCGAGQALIGNRRIRLLVPGAGFEPATNGLQNRCSTTELTRHEGTSNGWSGKLPHDNELTLARCQP